MALSEKNIRNIFIYTVPKFANYGLKLLALPVLTRLLTPEDFGIVALAWIFPTIAVSAATCGLVSSVQRYYFEYRHDSQKLNALVFTLQLFMFASMAVTSLAVFIFKGLVAGLVIGDPKYGQAVFISYVSAFLGQIISFYLTLFQNMERAKQHSAFSVMQAAATAVLSLLFVWYFRMSYMGMIYGSLAGTLLVACLIIWYFNRGGVAAFSRKMLAENIKYGLQVVPKSFTGFINNFFDKYMLNSMLSLSVVGVYNIGQNIGNVMFFLMGNVWSSFQPVYYKEVFDKGDGGSAAVGKIFTVFTYVSLGPLLFVILFARELIWVMAPPSYYGALDIIIIISAGVATQVFGMYVAVQYAYSKKAYIIFPVSVFSTLLNVAANIMLIPRYGLIGASISTVISTAGCNVILVYAGQKLYRIQYEWKTISALFAIIAGGVASALYFRDAHSYLFFYFIKLLLMASYVYAGISSGLVTQSSMKKVYGSLFKVTKEA